MMKRLVLALGLCLFALPAWAACGVTNLQVKDNAGTTANVPYADDGSGGTNCSPQIQIKQGGNVAVVKGASTAAVAADPSFVTNESPNSQLSTAIGTKADTATCATSNTVIACLRQIDTDVQAGVGSTGSGVPAAAIYPGYNVGGTLRGATGVNPSGSIYAGQVDIASIGGNAVGDLCAFLPKSGASINLTASGQVITGTAAKKTYICSIDLVSATAQNIALVEGTGSVCATNIFGLAGGTTAATGWNLAANGGLTKGSGVGTVYSPSADTNATAANVCLLLSGSGQTSGQITYVQG